MTLKDLRDYIDSLDLEHVSKDIEIVSCTNYINESGAVETCVQVDSGGFFGLDFGRVNPVLMIYTDEAQDFIESMED